MELPKFAVYRFRRRRVTLTVPWRGGRGEITRGDAPEVRELLSVDETSGACKTAPVKGSPGAARSRRKRGRQATEYILGEDGGGAKRDSWTKV